MIEFESIMQEMSTLKMDVMDDAIRKKRAENLFGRLVKDMWLINLNRQISIIQFYQHFLIDFLWWEVSQLQHHLLLALQFSEVSYWMAFWITFLLPFPLRWDFPFDSLSILVFICQLPFPFYFSSFPGRRGPWVQDPQPQTFVFFPRNP